MIQKQIQTIVITAALLSAVSQARTIASYSDDFDARNPSGGWAYCWNPTGVDIGDSSGYRDLQCAKPS